MSGQQGDGNASDTHTSAPHAAAPARRTRPPNRPTDHDQPAPERPARRKSRRPARSPEQPSNANHDPDQRGTARQRAGRRAALGDRTMPPDNGVTILSPRPGETREQFIRRVCDTAPPPTPELLDLLAQVLPRPKPGAPPRNTHPRFGPP
ncbi:hypothetical protein GCM10023321_72540 [Pseudonocardia eucalypti]|uniref:Uncharacterized protein n=1 Tax=Pseudonocardia eucalypti TaxID=648755 RepID=A0ABP9R747_9PSEU|nr:hypothetical protein [Pseudonocardia eucalypti]